MAVPLCDIIAVLERIAPPELAEEGDNCGLQLGDPQMPVEAVWVALDPAAEVVAAACEADIDLLVTHHPLFFRPLKRIDLASPLGSVLEQALRHRLAVYSMHTNLDAAADGLNDLLARKIGLDHLRPLTGGGDPPRGRPQGLGRIGRLRRSMVLAALAPEVKRRMGASVVRTAGDPALRVREVAVSTGSGGSLVPEFLASTAKVFISGDIRYHDAREIESAGRAVIDIGHFHSEHLMVAEITSRLRRHFRRRRMQVRVEACPIEKDPFRAE